MRVEVLGRERVFDGFLKVDHARLRFERFDGSMTPAVQRLSLERGDSVAAIVYHTAREHAVLVEQFRWPTHDKGPGWLVETVAGVVEDGENPEHALIREIEEEIGYRPDRLEPISTFYVSPGGSTERIFLYSAEISEAGRVGVGGGLLAESEDIRQVHLSLSELAEATRRGRIVDAKTIIAVCWLLERHGRSAWMAADEH